MLLGKKVILKNYTSLRFDLLENLRSVDFLTPPPHFRFVNLFWPLIVRPSIELINSAELGEA
jgi:hypothetical protein